VTLSTAERDRLYAVVKRYRDASAVEATDRSRTQWAEQAGARRDYNREITPEVVAALVGETT
jgi:hypothetical protein